MIDRCSHTVLCAAIRTLIRTLINVLKIINLDQKWQRAKCVQKLTISSSKPSVLLLQYISTELHGYTKQAKGIH